MINKLDICLYFFFTLQNSDWKSLCSDVWEWMVKLHTTYSTINSFVNKNKLPNDYLSSDYTSNFDEPSTSSNMDHQPFVSITISKKHFN